MKRINMLTKSKINLFIIVLVTVFIAISCSNNNEPVDNNNYKTEGKKVLVGIVENADIMGFGDEIAFSAYKPYILPIFSNIFGVPQSEMQDKSLAYIIENYAEEYQLRSLKEAAAKGYNLFVGLTDGTANKASIFDSLKILQNEGYCIDMVMCLHANSKVIRFNDASYNITDVTSEIASLGIKIRAIYQTCCVSKPHIDYWKNIGVEAVNGADGNNSITMFSPVYFVEEWINGKTFEDAGFTAYNREIEKLRSYDSPTVPINAYFLNSETLKGSKQNVGGLNPQLLWKNIPIITVF
jgi:hypothetical protein